MKSVLKHYIGLIYREATGETIDRDCKREIDAAVEEFKESIKEEVKEEIIKEKRQHGMDVKRGGPQ